MGVFCQALSEIGHALSLVVEVVASLPAIILGALF